MPGFCRAAGAPVLWVVLLGLEPLLFPLTLVLLVFRAHARRLGPVERTR